MYHMCPPIYAKGHPLHYTRTENSTIGVRIKIHNWWQRDGLKGTRLRVACLVLCPYWLAYAKSLYSFVLADLGQSTPSNILAHPSLLMDFANLTENQTPSDYYGLSASLGYPSMDS